VDALAECAVEGEIIRAVDFNIKPGVRSDEGKAMPGPICAGVFLLPISSSVSPI
jgi:hypothetical protein